MREKALWLIGIIAILCSSLLFDGCASDHPIKKDLASLGPLRVVTSCVPYTGVKVRHSGGEIAAIATSVGSTVGGYFADGGVRKWEADVERSTYSANLPRYFELVMQKVVEKLGGEIPEWQPVVVDDGAVAPEVIKSLLRDPAPLLVLASGSLSSNYTCAPGLSTAHGLESKYHARLYIGGDLVWEDGIEYISDHEKGRYRKIKEFSENNWQLLKEEMEYAADLIASKLVEDLKKEIRRKE